jgi:hypothetical protein
MSPMEILPHQYPATTSVLKLTGTMTTAANPSASLHLHR